MAANIDKNENVVVSVRGVTKEYDLGEQKIKALDKVSLDILKGELITIQGPSGCGKTTLLNILSIMDTPTSGDVFIGGKKATGLSDGQQSEIRATSFGYVFQFYNLINHLTALENVRLALDAAGGRDKKNRDEIATKVLTRVGLGNRLQNKPDQLSGGEQQRVAIARALVNDPAIIIADEPTGDLDTETGKEIIGILKELNEKDGRTILIVTHDLSVAAVGKRKILMRDYKIVSNVGEIGQLPEQKQKFIDLPEQKDVVVDKKASKKMAAEEREKKKAAEEAAMVKRAEEYKAMRKAEEEKRAKDAEESARKATEAQVAKIKELIDVSEKIKIQDIADILNISRKDLIQKIVPLAKNLNVQISGDFLNVAKDSTNAFVDEIEKQFVKWGKDSKI